MIAADCGSPPVVLNAMVSLSGDFLTFFSGDTSVTTVANQGARASYTCLVQELVLNGDSELVCELIDDARAEWSPSMAPTCERRKYEEKMIN